MCFASFLFFSITSASSRSTWLCRYIYLPCVRLTFHPESTCCRVPLFPHKGQSGVSESFHLCRFVGVGNTSYTDLRRNCSWYWRYRHISDHVRDRCSNCNLDQAPWLLILLSLPSHNDTWFLPLFQSKSPSCNVTVLSCAKGLSDDPWGIAHYSASCQAYMQLDCIIFHQLAWQISSRFFCFS